MDGRNRAARAFVVLGSVVLLASAALHSFAGYHNALPALTASNLNPGLQQALKVVFFSLGWHWVVIAMVALTAGMTETTLRRPLVMLCGLAVLLEAGVGASIMGFFIGNEIIGAAALLLLCGGLLFDRSGRKSEARAVQTDARTKTTVGSSVSLGS